MEKFFLFRKEEINDNSARASDTGVGLSVLAIPTKHVSFITAQKGAVIITFNDASLYEHIELFDSEAIEKTSVTVSCNIGEEFGLLENIISFMSSSNKSTIKFDVVEENSTFKKAVLSSSQDIEAKIKVNPIQRATGRISNGSQATEFQGTVGDIFFGENLPSLDFNHEGLAGYANGAEITAWANAGTGGSTYSIAANVGDPTNETGLTAGRGLAKVNATINFDDYFVVPNAYKVQNDYTIYLAFTADTAMGGMGVIYGDDSGETMGFCFGNAQYDASGGIDKATSAFSTFKTRHDGRTGEPAKALTSNSQNGTVKYSFPENLINTSSGETLQVFIIRRDADFNMYLHNRNGDLVSFIPSFTILNTIGETSAGASNMTDGDLLIEQIGSGGGITASGPSLSFNGQLARFGVIESDIGANASANLAKDLFELYNF
mgnify:CR=1 FL=1|tara:strand:- start:2787 stop:4088 length:1302 start_codon:yes stop_codon:yes gene_type:complete